MGEAPATDFECVSGLPEHLLPKWLLLVSTIATFSAGQSILEHTFNRKVYTKGGASGAWCGCVCGDSSSVLELTGVPK